MKSSRIVLSLISVACLVGCNKGEPSKELTPIDDIGGIKVAEGIYEFQADLWSQVEKESKTQEELAALVGLLPKKLTLTEIQKINGKKKALSVEQIYNNVTTIDNKHSIDVENMKAHYSYFIREETLTGWATETGEGWLCYNEPTKEILLLCKLSIGQDLKFRVALASDVEKENAKLMMASLAYSTPIRFEYSQRATNPTGYSILDYITGAIYVNGARSLFLEYISSKSTIGDKEIYNLPAAYSLVKTSLDEYKDGKQYFNWQFGSNNIYSLSLKHNISFDSSYMRDNVLYNGYAQGMAALDGYTTMSPYDDIMSTLPDLFVFDNNFLKYADYSANIDIASAASRGAPAGTYYTKVNTTRNLDINYEKSEDILVPSLDEYPLFKPAFINR